MNELKCPSETCAALMGAGKPYVSILGNVRTLGWSSLAHKSPDGYVFECGNCGARVDLPSRVPASSIQ